MRIELAILAALGTMACAAQADGDSPSVEDATNLAAQLSAEPSLPTLQDIASTPTADADVSRIDTLKSVLTAPPTLQSDPCPPCGRG